MSIPQVSNGDISPYDISENDYKPDSLSKLTQSAMNVLDDRLQRVKAHEKLCEYLKDTYRKKNAAYGDSFGEAFRTFGPTSALIRIFDKWYRLKTLLYDNVKNEVQDEDVRDTLLDMANYCLMTVMEIDKAASSTDAGDSSTGINQTSSTDNDGMKFIPVNSKIAVNVDRIDRKG